MDPEFGVPVDQGGVRVDQASGAAVGDHEAAKSATHLADLWPFDLCLGGGEVMGKHGMAKCGMGKQLLSYW